MMRPSVLMILKTTGKLIYDLHLVKVQGMDQTIYKNESSPYSSTSTYLYWKDILVAQNFHTSRKVSTLFMQPIWKANTKCLPEWILSSELLCNALNLGRRKTNWWLSCHYERSKMLKEDMKYWKRDIYRDWHYNLKLKETIVSTWTKLALKHHYTQDILA